MEKDFFVKLYATRIQHGERESFRRKIPHILDERVARIEKDIIRYKSDNAGGKNDALILEAIVDARRAKEERIAWLR